MKRASTFIVLMMVFAQACGQEQTFTKDYYLKKSENQGTAGKVLLIGGTAMAIAGILISDNGESNDDLGYGPTFDAGAFLFIGGVAADLISIPLLISSGRNARKAASISFQNQRIQLPNQTSSCFTFQPTLTVKIRLGH